MRIIFLSKATSLCAVVGTVLIVGAKTAAAAPPIGSGKCYSSASACAAATGSGRSGGSGLGPGGTRLTTPTPSTPSTSWSPPPRSSPAPASSYSPSRDYGSYSPRQQAAPGYSAPGHYAPSGSAQQRGREAYQEGLRAAGSGNWEAAERHFREALNQNPGDWAAAAQYEQARAKAAGQRQEAARRLEQERVSADTQRIVNNLQGFVKSHGETDPVRLEFAGAAASPHPGGALEFVNDVDTGNKSPGAQLMAIHSLVEGGLTPATAGKGFDDRAKPGDRGGLTPVRVVGTAPAEARQERKQAPQPTEQVRKLEGDLEKAIKERMALEEKLQPLEKAGPRDGQQAVELVKLRDQLDRARNQENHYTALLRMELDRQSAATPPAAIPTAAVSAAPSSDAAEPAAKAKDEVRKAPKVID